MSFTTYNEVVEYLFQLRQMGSKLGLEKVQKLAQWVGNPEAKLNFIHVAGTNGKGSTCAMLESIYRASGRRVGLFTSPHLISFTERFQINRVPIPESAIISLVNELHPLMGQFPTDDRPTFFELTTIMALLYFAREGCDLVVWETGLGGRLDASNMVTPEISVITSIGMDHQQWLGNTLEQIAFEKAGIIKPSIPVVVGPLEEASLAVVREKARSAGAPLSLVSKPTNTHRVSLPGPHQCQNAAVAIEVVRVLNSRFPVAPEHIRTGLATTYWAGRLQKMIVGSRTVWLDGAHNVPGLQALAKSLPEVLGEHKPALLVGMLGDKDWKEMIQILGRVAERAYLVSVDSDRTILPSALAAAWKQVRPDTDLQVCASVPEAWEAMRLEPLVLVTGSLYLVGTVLQLLQGGNSERFLNEALPVGP